MNAATEARIRRELRIAYDHGVEAGKGHWIGPSRENAIEVGYEQIVTAILADDTLAGPETDDVMEEHLEAQ